jgi:hypothetical protein
VPSLLLATDPGIGIANYAPFDLPVSPPFQHRRRDIIGLDALKVAFAATRDAHYLELFRAQRDRVLEETGMVPPGKR